MSILEDSHNSTPPAISTSTSLESPAKQAWALITLRQLIISGLANKPESMAQTLGISPEELAQLLEEVNAERPDIFETPNDEA